MLLRYAALSALLASSTAFNIPRQDTGGVSDAEDTTVTVTETDLNVDTVSATTTFFKTVFSTIVITKTDLTTTTVTEKDVDTATSTIYTTITQAAKRWVVDPPAAPAAREMPPPTLTADSEDPKITSVDKYNIELLVRKGILAKRATVTTTVTIAEDGTTTVFKTITSTVVSTTSSETTSVSTITTTAFENAKTTVTITSTIVIKATTVTTGPAQTVDSIPPDANIGTDTAEPTGGPDGSTSTGGSSGLSTGAKAGIGAAAGVVGLAVISGLAYYFYKQHKAKPRVVDDGSGAGMSEVPVGGIGVGGATSSRHSRTPDPKPPLSSGMGHGQQQEYYKPSGPAELGGTSKAPDAEMGGDELPRFPEASEADSRPVMGHTSGPVDPVYEMPAQHYR